MKNVNNMISKKRYSIEQFINTESLLRASTSFDNQYTLYASDRSGVYNAYVTSMDGSTEPRQLTHSTSNAIFPVTFLPNNKSFIYESDEGGNELTHLYLQNELGEIKDLTPGNQVKAAFFDWNKAYTHFFYESNKRDARYMDLYEMDIDSYASKLVYENNAGYHIHAISSNKKYIALQKPITANNSDIYLYSAEAGHEHLSPHEGDVQYIPLTFDEQATYLYYLTDENNEFLQLKRMNLSTKEVEIVINETWDIVMAKFSPNYQYLMYALNQDGKIALHVLDAKTNEQIPLSNFPNGQLNSVSFSKDETQMALLLNSSDSPTNLYVYHFKKQEIKRLTDTLNPEINQVDLVKAKVIRYPSFDGLSIPAIYYKPHIAEGDKVPALVWVHGGPGGQSMANYSPLFQYLANHGYAILAVNNRGSSGYGKTFFKAADLKHGEVDLADCIEAKSFLSETGYIDENRIGIIGGSYGGYMVLAALAFEPDSFEVGVDIFGVSNWERTLKEIPAWWEANREALYKKIGNPYTDTAYIRSISPLFHADNIKKPLIVLQGANDPRVLKVESDEIVEAVEKNNIPVEYIVFEDEGHGFTKRENQIKGYKAIKEFLDQHL
ncbi:alpha/beta fold hydrolase [Virgibacillus soli]|uniref:Acyl-peptide hydrolase n=1 Tax=Paracerasibacillus soli TaxID=480284 RepID=A0ABU5CMW8_9BACI|nr:alpha/beta fold hydrolase [Virgibacillus soli]MDY0407703.1 alpha/beta fold hydrolase [Virgibacillus soli]